MQLIVTLLLSAIVVYAGDAAAEPFQIPTSGNDIREAYLVPAASEGRVVGLAGLVQEIEKGHNGRPLIRVALRKPNDAKTSIWIGSLVTPKAGQIAVGQIVRVLGYLSRVDANDSLTQSVVKDPLFVIGFCLVDEASKVGIFLPEGIKQCIAWQEGAMPSDLAKPEANRAAPADAEDGAAERGR